MTVKIEKEPQDFSNGLPLELCCVCRHPTSWWYGSGPKNVALCPECAEAINEEELPTKAEWLAKEREITLRNRPWKST